MSPSPPRHSRSPKHRRSRSRSSSFLSSLLSHSFPSGTPTRADLDQLDIIVELLKRDGRRQDKRRARRQRRERERSAFFASSQGSRSSSSSSRRSYGRSEEEVEQSQPASSQRHIHHHDEQQEESPRTGSGSSSFQRYLRQREEQPQPQTTSSSPCPCLVEHREEEAQQQFWKPAPPSDSQSQSTIVSAAGSRHKPIPVFDEEEDDDGDDAVVEKAGTSDAPPVAAASTTLESEPRDLKPAQKASSSSSSSILTRHASPMVLIPAIPSSKRRRTKSPSPTPRRRRSSLSQRGKPSREPACRAASSSSSSSSSSTRRPALRERSDGARQLIAKQLALDSEDESLLDADSDGSEWGEMTATAKAQGKSRAVSSDLSDLSEEEGVAQEGEASQTSSQRSRGTERPLEDTYLSLASRRDLYCLSLCYERTTTQTNLLGCILAHVGPTGKYPKVDLRETPDLNGVYYGHEIRLGALMLIAQGRLDEALSTIEVAPGVSEKQMSHLCHNRACIHPRHIVVETRCENEERNQCKGHTDEVTCTHGPQRCLLPFKWQCAELRMKPERDGTFKRTIERDPKMIPTFEPLLEREREEVELERLRRLAADAAPLVKRKRGRPPGTGKRQREEQERLEEARLEGWRLARERREEEEESELVAMRAAAAAAAATAAAATARPKKRPILPPERRRNLALESDWDLD